jgi:hypothetical protein
MGKVKHDRFDQPVANGQLEPDMSEQFYTIKVPCDHNGDGRISFSLGRIRHAMTDPAAEPVFAAGVAMTDLVMSQIRIAPIRMGSSRVTRATALFSSQTALASSGSSSQSLLMSKMDCQGHRRPAGRPRKQHLERHLHPRMRLPPRWRLCKQRLSLRLVRLRQQRTSLRLRLVLLRVRRLSLNLLCERCMSVRRLMRE